MVIICLKCLAFTISHQMSAKAVTPSVEEIENVVSPPVAAPAPAETAPAAGTPQEFYTISDVANAIRQKFGRTFPKLIFRPHAQMTDGCTVEFVDTEMETPIVIATARLRLRNSMMVDPKSGVMWMRADLSDLSFGAGSLKLVARSENDTTEQSQ